MPWAFLSAAGALTGAFLSVPAEPVRSWTSGSGVTEPGSGRAVPRAWAGLPAVGEGGAVVDGQHGLGVVPLPERLPDLGAFGDPVLLLGGQQRERRLHLAATAATELTADDRGDRDQVGQLERLDLTDVGDRVDLAGEDVLAGEVAALLGLVAVRVDAVDIRLRVGHGLLTAGALMGPDVRDLGFEIGLGVRGLRPELLLKPLVGECATGERGQFAAPDVPEEVHQPEPVLPGRIAAWPNSVP